MLKRIYIDNYKSLVNFELEVNEINLLLGANGAGKSAVFEILRGIQDFVRNGGRVASIFVPENQTRWQDTHFQTFELEIEGNEGLYKYQLSIEHYEDGTKARVDYERLWFNNNPLLKVEKGDVQLYRDDYSEGPNYSVDWSLSAVGAIPSRHDNRRLTWFKEQLSRFIIIQIIPPMMFEESAQEDSKPSPYLENYISWYRYISQDQGMAFQLMSELKEVLPGFDYFRFEAVGEKHRSLKVYFRNEETRETFIGYDFGELSDGQRMLIALYSLLYSTRADQSCKYTLCLDEPENFLALPEIQPWLRELYDSCIEGETQALLISHHPELINYLLASPVGYWFERQTNRPTRVRPITAEGRDGLPISEIIARGWLND